MEDFWWLCVYWLVSCQQLPLFVASTATHCGCHRFPAKVIARQMRKVKLVFSTRQWYCRGLSTRHLKNWRISVRSNQHQCQLSRALSGIFMTRCAPTTLTCILTQISKVLCSHLFWKTFSFYTGGRKATPDSDPAYFESAIIAFDTPKWFA